MLSGLFQMAAHPAADVVHATGESLTLMMAQYLELRAPYPGHVIFFRVADFYVLFFEDVKAKPVSRALGKAPIRRMDYREGSILVSAVPLDQSDDCMQGLLWARQSIAICEYVEDACAASERSWPFVIRRGVVRSATPCRRRRASRLAPAGTIGAWPRA